MMKLFHPFHLVTFSPWPLLMSFSLMITFFGVFMWIFMYKFFLFLFGINLILLIMFQWFRDIIREGTFQGMHSILVQKGLKLGMILFIISEVFFFLSIFWCYFHMFLSPSIEIGSNWPPKNIKFFNPYGIPLLNTLLLLSSGVSITYSHYSILLSKKLNMIFSMKITIILGIVFSFFQYKEYCEASFTFSDSVFGSIFFMSTGFHGLHVIVGTLFLLVSLLRMYLNHFSSNHHFGFEASAWYWHFVDVVWLFLYTLVYFWSN